MPRHQDRSRLTPRTRWAICLWRANWHAWVDGDWKREERYHWRLRRQLEILTSTEVANYYATIERFRAKS